MMIPFVACRGFFKSWIVFRANKLIRTTSKVQFCGHFIPTLIALLCKELSLWLLNDFFLHFIAIICQWHRWELVYFWEFWKVLVWKFLHFLGIIRRFLQFYILNSFPMNAEYRHSCLLLGHFGTSRGTHWTKISHD